MKSHCRVRDTPVSSKRTAPGRRRFARVDRFRYENNRLQMWRKVCIRLLAESVTCVIIKTIEQIPSGDSSGVREFLPEPDAEKTPEIPRELSYCYWGYVLP